MADIELIIMVPEKEFGIEINDKFQDFFNRLKAEIKERLINGTTLVCGAYELETIEMFLNAFANVIYLPKGHGRLIDADELLKDRHRAIQVINVIEAPIIIGADRSEK